MSNSPFLCLVWALTEPPNLPGFPGGGQGIWGGGPHPTPPIHHPGHPDHGKPVDPSWGVGGGEHPGNRPPMGGAHPGNRPPGSGGGGHIDNALPDGEDVEIDNELPPIPPEYADKTIVAIKRPDQEWIIKAYDPAQVDNTLPQTPEPK